VKLKNSLFAATLIAAPLSSQAQPANPPPVTGDRPGLKIAPTKYEETVTPGKPKDGTADVFNISKQPLTVVADVQNIRMVGDNGDLEFFTGDNPYKLNSFVENDKTPFTLDVGEARKVNFRISIPPGVFPGGYFGAVLFRIVPPGAEANGDVHPDPVGWPKTGNRHRTHIDVLLAGRGKQDLDGGGAVV